MRDWYRFVLTGVRSVGVSNRSGSDGVVAGVRESASKRDIILSRKPRWLTSQEPSGLRLILYPVVEVHSSCLVREP